MAEKMQHVFTSDNNYCNKQQQEDKQQHAVMLTCLHLSQVKKWHSVKVMRCAKLHMTFIHASKQYQGSVECILPLSVDDALNMNMLTDVSTQLCQEHSNSLTLALVENDSTIVYYNIFHGLHLPTLPNREARQAV